MKTVGLAPTNVLAANSKHWWLTKAAWRFGWFVLIFSLAPAAGALLAALRGSARLAVVWDTIEATPAFALLTFAHTAAAALLLAFVLCAASFWAWSAAAQQTGWRVLRLHFVLLTIAYVLYPTMAAKLPIVAGLPFWLTASVLVVGTGAMYLVRFAATGWRELLFAAVVSGLFFVDLPTRMTRAHFERMAGRQLNARDVVVVGFDSITHEQAAPVLAEFTPREGRKVVYENASTPMAVTNAAWRSIFSGLYPDPLVLPGEVWGHERNSWLPDDLRAKGYSVVMYQDDPSTNIFSRDEKIDVLQLQGWKWMLHSFAWRTCFPLSEVSASWWLAALGGPAHASTRQSFRPEFFQDRMLAQTANAARHGPVFMAAHSCYVHIPVQLKLREIVKLPGWWRKSPEDFHAGANYFSGVTHERGVAAVRAASACDFLRATLRQLETVGVLGHAQVVVLSDHGPRAAWLPSSGVHHVMLAAFLPQRGEPVSVPQPVSLVDLAPTLRKLLDLPSATTDGEPLPLTAQFTHRLNATRQLTPPSIQGGSRALFNPRAIGLPDEVEFRDDGTFHLSDELKREIRAVIAKENRQIEGIRRMIEHGQQVIEEPGGDR